MKKIRLAISALALMASAWFVPVSAQNFVGKWNAVVKNDMMGDMKSVMTITKDEEDNYKASMGDMAEIKAVYVNKDVITFQVSAMGFDLSFSLTMTDENTLEGDIDVMGNSLFVKAERVIEEEEKKEE